jgi:DNA repair exonuclease SbcCD nuclease subunit
MGVMFIADVHVGNHRLHSGSYVSGVNQRCRDVLGCLDMAVMFAYVDANIEHLFVLGDLFDTARPSPQVIGATQHILTCNQDIAVLAGNHDLSSEDYKDNALSPLHPVVSVVESLDFLKGIIPGKDLVMFPYRSGSVLEKLSTELHYARVNGSLERPLVLCGHFGVWDNNTPGYLRGSPDSIKLSDLENLCLTYQISHVFVGHWHARRTWDLGHAQVVQIGALAPVGFRDPGENYGYAQILNNDGSMSVKQFDGPRFLNATSEEFVGLTVAGNPRAHRYIRWHVPAVDLAACQKIAELLQKQCDYVTIQCVPEQRDTMKRSAKRVSRGMDAILAGHVKNRAIPDGVDREEVLTLSRQYLERAKT